MIEHPVDRLGRVLPDPGWPVDRTAPGSLELVRRFCNSLNRENGADRFEDARGFDEWLACEGREPTGPGSADLELVAKFRESLHDLTVSNAARQPAPHAWAAISDLLGQTSYHLRARGDGAELVAIDPSPTVELLGTLALICLAARDHDTLRRLKSCSSCGWTVFDHSKNSSSRWCSMSACGTRHNAKAYRQRLR